MSIKVIMTQGSMRLLDFAKTYEANLDKQIEARVDEVILANSDEFEAEFLTHVETNVGRMNFYLEGKVSYLKVGVDINLKTAILDDQMITLMDVPHTIIANHIDKIPAGLMAREILDFEILEGIQIKGVSDFNEKSGPNRFMAYLLCNGWRGETTYEFQ